MYKTLVVLKESKFNETKFSHPSNIDSISVTCEVSKLVTFKDINYETLTIAVEFNKKDYKEFFESLSGIKIKEFEEKPFTLQDYFMSFYKEEKEFGGLSGLKGNTK